MLRKLILALCLLAPSAHAEPGSALSSLGAISQRSIAAPTAPASTSAYAMQGLACYITPHRTGNLIVTISGTIVSPAGTAAGTGISYQISRGTGAAPANAASLTGTQIGQVQTYMDPTTVTAADVSVPFSHQFVITNLTIGVPVWIDEAAKSLGTISDMGLSAVQVTVVEQ